MLAPSLLISEPKRAFLLNGARGFGKRHFHTGSHHFLPSCFHCHFISFLAQWLFSAQRLFCFPGPRPFNRVGSAKRGRDRVLALFPHISKADLDAAVTAKDTSGNKGQLITHLLQLLQGTKHPEVRSSFYTMALYSSLWAFFAASSCLYMLFSLSSFLQYFFQLT